MKAEPCIVLRRRAPFRRSVAAGPLVATPLGLERMPQLGEPVLERHSLTPEEKTDLKRDPEVHAVANAMPLRLIGPKGGAQPHPAERMAGHRRQEGRWRMVALDRDLG